MAKTKTAKPPKTALQPTVQTVTAPVPTFDIKIGLHPTAAAEAMEAATVAATLAITDKDSHEVVKRHGKGWKARRREIESWYREQMVTPLNKALGWARDQMNADLAKFDGPIAIGEKLDLVWTRERERIEREAAAERQRVAEAAEQARRDKEAEAAEAAALKLEAATDVLSPREERFVYMVLNDQRPRTQALLVGFAKACGYKDATASATKLMNTPKIQTAIANAERARAIRQEAEAKKAAPIIVEVAPVESHVAKVSGTSLRTYYSCGDVDLKALVLACAENIQHGDGTMLLALEPNMVYLNGQARDLKEMFPRVHPYAKVVKRDGVAS